MTDQILLTGIEFYGYHGCNENERQRGQIFRVDVELNLDLSKAGKSDNIDETVDYAKALDIVKSIVIGEPKNLIEAVAEDIATILLKTFALLESVKITVQKPSVPLANVFNCAAVSIFRSRNETHAMRK